MTVTMERGAMVQEHGETTSGERTGRLPRDGKRILVVEDDAPILRQIAFSLENNGYQVETATTGVEALRRLIMNPPDLLITDVMMPEMDGYELVSSLRTDTELANLPVIMLTAKTLDEDVAEGYNSGTDLYLTKPFNPVELLAFVQRILG
jgi:two-component system alkaline phosphatase synthesis response regulator PhoP/two-component system response regulator VicR